MRLARVQTLAHALPDALASAGGRAVDRIGGYVRGWPEWAQVVALALGALLAAWALHWLVFRVLRAVSRTAERRSLSRLVGHVRWPSLILLIAISLRSVAESSIVTTGWTGQHKGAIDRALIVLIILSVTWLVIGGIGAIDHLILARYRVDVKDNLLARRMHTQVKVLSRTLAIVVGIIGVGSALMTFDQVQQVGASLLASAGIAALVLGMAARPTLGNVIAGVQIALTQPIRLDDAVVIAGEWGWIEEITTTYVVVRIWDERRLIVPFSTIIDQPFQNWTRTSANILGTVVIHADYRLPVQALRAEVERLVETSELWDRRVCVVQVTDCTERTMQVRILVSGGDSPSAWDLRVWMREQVIAFLQREHSECLPLSRVRLESPSGQASQSC